jgi:hypothetical protein
MRSFLPIVSLLALAVACGGDRSPVPGPTPAVPAAPAAKAQWTADAHTHGAIAKMEAVAKTNAVPADGDVAAFRRLGEALDAEIEALFTGCRMTGPDHDALHGWLGELMPAVRTLRESTDLAKLREAQQKIAAELPRFHTLFAPLK